MIKVVYYTTNILSILLNKNISPSYKTYYGDNIKEGEYPIYSAKG